MNIPLVFELFHSALIRNILPAWVLRMMDFFMFGQSTKELELPNYTPVTNARALSSK
jgi:hypothetical protein